MYYLNIHSHKEKLFEHILTNSHSIANNILADLSIQMNALNQHYFISIYQLHHEHAHQLLSMHSMLSIDFQIISYELIQHYHPIAQLNLDNIILMQIMINYLQPIQSNAPEIHLGHIDPDVLSPILISQLLHIVQQNIITHFEQIISSVIITQSSNLQHFYFQDRQVYQVISFIFKLITLIQFFSSHQIQLHLYFKILFSDMVEQPMAIQLEIIFIIIHYYSKRKIQQIQLSYFQDNYLMIFESHPNYYYFILSYQAILQFDISS